MKFVRFTSRRLIFVLPQLVGVTIITFLLVRLIPGDPARLLTGPFATEETIEALRERLGLTEPLLEQYWVYLKDLVQGDWGRSFATGNPVFQDIRERLPATLELVLLSLILMTLLGIGLGVLVALRSTGIVDRLTFLYGMLAGSLPDFWLGLVLSYVFFFQLGWFPAPIGRIDVGSEPPTITGFYTIDTVAAGDWGAFVSALKHLALPVITLVFVYTGAILKMTRATLEDLMHSDFIVHAEAMGLPPTRRLRYMLRNALPPVITVVAITFSFLLGGAVLVESVFSWNGVGQYAVSAVSSADYSAIQGFVLIAAAINIVLYFVLDICYFMLDPRLEY